ncbi:eukaryotic translation initiation factor 4H-like [Tropilaelaps mercedesae]|uniref:Eukaryotic translation initiation factor 4H-like n=1 Tax=Tropilaelaps mercedesae TaxID=418985 RepID=A0A1V9XIW4_9ACAR|nr:eukaryotic translation initiation factor 4H-like [Tropilaelaps mercedesae]
MAHQHSGQVPEPCESNVGPSSAARRQPFPASEGPYTAFVGNLPDTVMQSDLEIIFRDIPLRSIRLVRDRDTNRFKGFCYVEFNTIDQLHDALELDGAEVDGQIIRVNVAQGRQDRRVGRRDGGRDQGDYQQRRNQAAVNNNVNNRNNNYKYNNNGLSRRQDKPAGVGSGGRDFQGPAWNMRRRSQQLQQPQQQQPGRSDQSRPSDSSKDSAERPRLKLTPRTVSTPVAALADAMARSSIFGEGKPRDERALDNHQRVRKQSF